MKHYNYKLISNNRTVIGINIDILNITIKKCKLHILPSFRLIYNTISNYITFDLDWLIFELRFYIVILKTNKEDKYETIKN